VDTPKVIFEEFSMLQELIQMYTFSI